MLGEIAREERPLEKDIEAMLMWKKNLATAFPKPEGVVLDAAEFPQLKEEVLNAAAEDSLDLITPPLLKLLAADRAKYEDWLLTQEDPQIRNVAVILLLHYFKGNAEALWEHQRPAIERDLEDDESDEIVWQAMKQLLTFTTGGIDEAHERLLQLLTDEQRGHMAAVVLLTLPPRKRS